MQVCQEVSVAEIRLNECESLEECRVKQALARKRARKKFRKEGSLSKDRE